MTEEMTMILNEISGLSTRFEERFDRMDERLDKVDERLDNVDEWLDKVDERFNRVDERLDQIDKRLDQMDDRFDQVDARFDGMEGSIRSLDYRVSDMERRMDDSELNQTKIRMILENDVLKSINIIAEGHLDLNRKLDEALKINQQKELMLLRISSLESDMKLVKQTLGVH